MRCSYMLMRWSYMLLLALPVMIGCNNLLHGGEFLPVFLAGLIFALMSIGSLEAMILARRLLRRQQESIAMLDELSLSHRAA
jgi:hypothetical protein